MDNYNIKLLKKIYGKDFDRLIINTEIEIMFAKNYNTVDSRKKVKRLEKFLYHLKKFKDNERR